MYSPMYIMQNLYYNIEEIESPLILPSNLTHDISDKNSNSRNLEP
jgi:hypothetical protein